MKLMHKNPAYGRADSVKINKEEYKKLVNKLISKKEVIMTENEELEVIHWLKMKICVKVIPLK